MKWIAVLIVLFSYVTAAAFYSPYVGFDGWVGGYLCPLCPNITTLWGTPLARFVRFTLVAGTANAVVLLSFALLILGALKLVTRATSK
jgi:hypothetical protein